MLKPQRVSSTHEELFIQRYEMLRGWALRLTGNNRGQAEDLLHDLFIHFTLHRPNLDEIHNLDGFLHTTLRNLFLSQSRRTARSAHGHLSLVDYDSAEISIQSVDPREQLRVREELQAICRYACLRKESSKAGSVLILRFFHGYYPGEIAQILGSPRQAVDNLLQTARAEAKTYLCDPNALVFMQDSATTPLEIADSTADILEGLRRAIFSSRQTNDCLAVGELRSLYDSKSEGLIDRKSLAHIVSCSNCLDQVNELLGIPKLAERRATDSLGPKSRKEDGGSSGGGTGAGGGISSVKSFVTRSKRRRKQVYEHRPKELHISVNGFVLGYQTISSETSELTLNVNVAEQIGFIEVYSENDVRLFFQNIATPPEGAVQQLSKVELSDGRSLQMALNFSDAWPKLQTVYRDPFLKDVPADLGTASENVLTQFSEGEMGNRWGIRHVRDWLSAVFNGGLWLKPSAVTSILAIVLAVALTLFYFRIPTAPISPSSLLQQSAIAENTELASANVVLHRTIYLEMSETGATGSKLGTRRIEVWQSADRGVSVRRLYDETGQLLAGDWRRSDGVQTLYHHGGKPQLQLAPEKRNLTMLLNADNIWQFSPSAKDFSLLIGDSTLSGVEDRGTAYVITAESEKSADALRASLALNKSDLHAAELVLVVGHRQYTFTETSFEHRKPDSVAPAVFEPERELLGDRATERAGEKAIGVPRPVPLTPSLVVATPELEVQVLQLLNQASADMDDQASVTRTAEGKLKVTGVVDTDARKSEIVRALEPIASNRAVQVDIETVDDVMRRQSRQSPSSVPTIAERVKVEKAQMPAYEDLQEYFGKDSDSQIQKFSSRILSVSSQVTSHAGTLKQLARRFSEQEVRSLSPEARRQWLAVIRSHARAIEQQTRMLRQELGPIFSDAERSTSSADAALISDDASLAQAMELLFALASANDRMISASFTISSKSVRSSAVKTAEFWRSLKSTERLAVRIQAFN